MTRARIPFKTRVRIWRWRLHNAWFRAKCHWRKRVTVPLGFRKRLRTEFDPCLDLDVMAMSVMTREEKDEYIDKIMKRRELAHRRFP